MRRLASLSSAPMVALALVGCVRENPAFDCDRPEACFADESDDDDPTANDDPTGDGDPDTATGDGDGDPGDGDGDPGDGDGDPGDGDPGDGDGDEPVLPSCPETTWIDVPVAKDTFLVARPHEMDLCVVDWNIDQNAPILSTHAGYECVTHEFGGAELLWVCNTQWCTSYWLGRYALGQLDGLNPTIMTAHAKFHGLVANIEPNLATLHSLDVDATAFGDCGDWSESMTAGELVDDEDCGTSYAYAAYDTYWFLDNQVDMFSPLAMTPIPGTDGMDAFEEIELVLEIEPATVQGWLAQDPVHVGVVLETNNAWQPTEFMLHAKESNKPPILQLEVCTEEP